MKYSPGTRCRASLSLPIIRASRSQHQSGRLTVGSLLSGLGEASFGWALVVLSLVNLLPLPPGFTLLTAIPLLVASAQVCLGYPSIRLPRKFADLHLDHDKLRRTVLRLRPLTRRLERLLQKRHRYVFKRKRRLLPTGVQLDGVKFHGRSSSIRCAGWPAAIASSVVLR
ncbi:exopolysaccharide biosynthesis protein [Salipiger pacificus]|uniref:Exopolysaccharide biosynthesis protein n=2 Tax=Salipiger mangrovisoli TaxID=2865933 RepID=A0ABR9X6M8_9RHOB|nr:exopolysaccharide biosynthesis protein [Salipiger mangrovisoli]MBE9639170.1 exopolysaccharide biosynthesis protein [Salipiger mangrovisoli]